MRAFATKAPQLLTKFVLAQVRTNAVFAAGPDMWPAALASGNVEKVIRILKQGQVGAVLSYVQEDATWTKTSGEACSRLVESLAMVEQLPADLVSRGLSLALLAGRLGDVTSIACAVQEVPIHGLGMDDFILEVMVGFALGDDEVVRNKADFLLKGCEVKAYGRMGGEIAKGVAQAALGVMDRDPAAVSRSQHQLGRAIDQLLDRKLHQWDAGKVVDLEMTDLVSFEILKKFV